jgi:hypothetical protein
VFRKWFIKTLDLGGHGTSWQQLNVYVLNGERLEVVTFEGEPLALRVGGITRMGEGIGCHDGRLELLRTEARNIRNTRWDTSLRSFELHGTKASFVSRTEGRPEPQRLQRPRSEPLLPAELRGAELLVLGGRPIPGFCAGYRK